MFGRWTFTTTSRPPCSVARCTWPSEAAASGCGSKAGVELRDRRPELGLDQLHCALAGEWPHVALQPGELVLPLERERVSATGDDLTELDVGGAQLLEHQPRLDRRGQRLHVDTPEKALHPSAQVADDATVEDRVGAIVHEDVIDLHQPQALVDALAIGRAAHAEASGRRSSTMGGRQAEHVVEHKAHHAQQHSAGDDPDHAGRVQQRRDLVEHEEHNDVDEEHREPGRAQQKRQRDELCSGLQERIDQSEDRAEGQVPEHRVARCSRPDPARRAR